MVFRFVLLAQTTIAGWEYRRPCAGPHKSCVVVHRARVSFSAFSIDSVVLLSPTSSCVQECTRASVEKTPSAKILEYLKEFDEQGVDMELAEWQGAVMGSLMKQADSVESFVEYFAPYSESKSPVPWAQRPSMATCCLSYSDKARVLQRSFVHDRLVPLIAQGPAGVESILQFSKAVIQLDLDKPDDSEEIVGLALQSLREIGAFFCTLADPSVDPKFRCGIDEVMSVMNAASGAKCLIKQAVLQQSYWRKREGEFRSFELAERTMTPDVKAAEQKLAAGDSGVLSETIRSLPRWHDAMRAGATENIQALLKTCSETHLQQLLDGTPFDADGANEHAETMDFAARMSPGGVDSAFYMDLAARARTAVREHHAASLAGEISEGLRVLAKERLGSCTGEGRRKDFSSPFYGNRLQRNEKRRVIMKKLTDFRL